MMVSDFITEHDCYLKLTKPEFDQARKCYPAILKAARVLFKYGAQTEGY